MACTKESHEAVKLDPVAWSRLELAGVQLLPGDADAPTEAFELRNCACHSTLARRVDLASYVRGIVADLRRALDESEHVERHMAVTDALERAAAAHGWLHGRVTALANDLERHFGRSSTSTKEGTES